MDELYRREYYLDRVRDSLRIGCLSECHDSLAMWSHYAESHKGICICYNTSKLLEKGIKTYKIHYSEELVDVKKEEFHNQVFAMILASLTKNHEYSYEREWRIWDIRKEWVNVEGCVEMVLLGVNCNKNLKGHVKLLTDFCESKNIPVKHMRISKDKFKVEIVEIKPIIFSSEDLASMDDLD